MTPVLPALLFVLILLVPAAVAADNSVKSLRLVTYEEFTRLVLVMEQEPIIKIDRVDEDLLHLTLAGIIWPLKQTLNHIGDERVKKLAFIGQDGAGDGLEITLSRPLHDIQSFWRAAKKELELDIYLLTEKGPLTGVIGATEPQANSMIAAVRLGTHQDFSRLVVECSEKTNYQLSQSSAERFTLQLDKAVLAKEFIQTELHDLRVRETNIASEDQKKVYLHIELAVPVERLDHFWWEAKNRLVVDIYGSNVEGDRDRKEVSSPVAEEQQEKNSNSETGQQVAAAEQVEPIADDTELKYWERILQGATGTERDSNLTDEKDAATAESAVAPVASKPSEDQGSSAGPTPEIVLETLVDSVAPKPADLLRRILSASSEKRTDKALRLITVYLQNYQDRAIKPLMILRGDLHFAEGLQGMSGSFSKATTAYRDSNVLSGSSPLQPWALLQLGRIQLQQKRYLEALGYLDLVINKYQRSAHRAAALIQRGRLYLEKDRADLALGDFQQVLNEYPDSPINAEAKMGKAISLSLRGEHKLADILFAELEKRIPSFYHIHPEILYYWGRNDIILERFRQGREKFFLALNVGKQPQDTDLILAHIGDSFRSQGQPERAAAYYRLTMKLFPRSDGAIVSRARLAEESGDMELMAEIIREHPESEMAQYALVRMAAYFHEKADYREAIGMLAQLERRYASSLLKNESRRLLRRSLQKRVEQLRSKNQYWELLALIKTVKLWLSDMYRLKAGLWEAEAYVKLSLWDDAVAALEAISPDDLEAQDRSQWNLLLARTYESTGKLVLAESLLRRLAKGVSGGEFAEQIKRQLATVYQKAGNHAQSVAAYEELLNEDLALAVRAKTLMDMAKSLIALGQYEEAKKTYQLVLSLSSDANKSEDLHAAAWAELGEIHYKESNFSLAAQAYRNALQYGEESSPSCTIHQLSRLATCYDKLGSPAKAQELYHRIEKEAEGLWRQMASVNRRIQELETKVNEVKQPEG
jgi:tetratricopeptide (TPR) repeat protein